MTSNVNNTMLSFVEKNSEDQKNSSKSMNIKIQNSEW